MSCSSGVERRTTCRPVCIHVKLWRSPFSFGTATYVAPSTSIRGSTHGVSPKRETVRARKLFFEQNGRKLISLAPPTHPTSIRHVLIMSIDIHLVCWSCPSTSIVCSYRHPSCALVVSIDIYRVYWKRNGRPELFTLQYIVSYVGTCSVT